MTAVPERTGEVIGGYHVQRTVGGGAYGCVYEAFGRGGKKVAVKVLRDELGESAERQRFEREAEILKGLNHDHVVRVLDFGYERGTVPFIVFELLEGRSLTDELLRVRFMSGTRAAAIARQILLALEHAHDYGVVHRDIKPHNIFLCSSGSTVDRVKVLDFGVAKSRLCNHETLTEPGAIVGTPSYMAPEQLRGDEVGPRADLFSVGIMLAQLLSGQRPTGKTLIEIYRNHIDEGPLTVPREVELSELGPLIKRSIEKGAADRFASATAMLEALDTVIGGASSQPTSASGTLLMPEHLDAALPNSSTVPIEDIPWLDKWRQ